MVGRRAAGSHRGLLEKWLGIPACKAVQRARLWSENARPIRLFHTRKGIASDVYAGSSKHCWDLPSRKQSASLDFVPTRNMAGRQVPLDLHHAGQMPGSAIHEVLPFQYNIPGAHPNLKNQGVTQKVRASDTRLHWKMRGQEMGNRPPGGQVRYLNDLDVRSSLAAGRDIEQLLPEGHELDELVIRYVSIERSSLGSWRVRLCEAFDNGTPEFLDVYEFEAVDPDFPFGNEWMFDSIQEALAFAENTLGASSVRYVNQGLIQYEYKDRYHPEW